MGDPSGIGPAVTLKAIQELKNHADFVVIGDKWVFDKVRSSKFGVRRYKFIDLDNVRHKNFEFGKIRAEYGRASIEYLKKAIELIKKKEIDCLVTAPICKEAINKAGFRYKGHTEFISERIKAKDTVMMLLNKHLRFSLASRHIPLKGISKNLNPAKLRKTILFTYSALKTIFLIKNPRIVVCGLNPHASDNGLIGEEEKQIIKPVLDKIRKQLDAHIEGPVSADAAIYQAYKKQYDCVIAMYHDQALIPLKLTDFDTGVNFTWGLGFIRTSPLHGTAFDIAGKPGLINHKPMMEAVKLAVKCTANLKRA
jgi:4-hydroxythreonine-4-phosphate dehydrogenase